MTTWPAPLYGTARVYKHDFTGWNYVTADGTHWTYHLTNALHDAGYIVTKLRKQGLL